MTNEDAEVPLIGFNVIEHLIKANDLSSNEIATALIGVNACNATALINLVNSVNHDELCLVKISKKNLVIPRDESVIMKCPVNTGPLNKPTPVLFEVDEEGPAAPRSLHCRHLITCSGK